MKLNLNKPERLRLYHSSLSINSIYPFSIENQPRDKKNQIDYKKQEGINLDLNEKPSIKLQYEH